MVEGYQNSMENLNLLQHKNIKQSCRKDTYYLWNISQQQSRVIHCLTEDIEGHLSGDDLWPACRALKMLCSSRASWQIVIRRVGGCLAAKLNGQTTRYTEYFQQFYTVDPPSGYFQSNVMQAADANPFILDPTSLDKVSDATAKLRGTMASVPCNISAELLQAWGEGIIRGLSVVLHPVQKCDTSPPD